MLLSLLACNGTEPEPPTPGEVTWHGDIAPLVQENCVVCHNEDGMQPDIVFSPETAQALAPSMLHEVTSGAMPPFYAEQTEVCDNPWGFAPDPRLSEEDKDLLAAWVDGGAPLGDPDEAAPLPEPPDGKLAAADVEAFPAGQYTTGLIGAVEDEFVCFSIEIGADQDRWLEAYQVLPEDLGVVHHVLIGIDEAGATAAMVDEDGLYDCFGGFGVAATFIGGWIPGASPVEFPEHSAYRVPAGSRIVLQMHYHLLDEARQDGTGVALRWAEDTPVQEAIMGLIGNSNSQNADGTGLQPGEADGGDPRFFIPAGASDHVETMKYQPWEGAPLPLETFLVANHMHYIGRDMRMWVERPGGEDCLVHTPDWDFDWQQFYFYDADSDAAPTVQPGDTLMLECRYDNSLENPAVKKALDEAGLDEPIDVTLGEGSLDEMCIGVLGQVYDVPTSVVGETHSGTVEVRVSSADFGFSEVSCTGPASVADDGSLEGVAACGLDLGGTLYTVMFSLDSSDVEVGVLYLEETIRAPWTGSVEEGITLDVSGDFAGGSVQFEGSIVLD